MSDLNRISATLSAQDVTDILAAITTIRTKLPFLVSLSNDERRLLPKLGDKSVGFDDKCTAYMTSNPEFIPGFVDPAEVAKDRTLRTDILQFFTQLSTLCEEVDDTLMVINSEIWMADLAYYQNVREGAKRGLGGADTIYGDLNPRFPGSRPPKTPPTPPAP
ncbi:MAG: hypothetical protein U1F71_17065 [Verrucomicrobiaceae bacterium]